MRRFVFILATLLMALLLCAPSALAHTRLVDSIPQAGEAVSTPITRIKLSFSTDVSTSLQKVRVTAPAGENIGGPPRVNGSIVTVPVEIKRPGTYTVSWRTIGADGHPISGAFAFAFRDTSQPATEVPHQDIQPRSTGMETYPVAWLERMSIASQAAFYLSLLIMVGGAIFATVIAPGWRPRYFRRSAILLIAASMTSFIVNLALAGEYSIWGVLNPWNIVPYSITPNGRVMAGCAIGAGILMWAYPSLKQAAQEKQSAPRVRIALAAIIVGVLPALGGHAWISQLPLLRVPADMLHLLAACIWFGGIVQLKDVSSASLAQHPAVYPAVKRFAQVAFVSVVVLVITGAIAVLLEIGLDFSDLFGTTYGQLVVAKIVLLACTIPLAKINQQRHVPALSEQRRSASVNLQRFVIFEIGLVAIIVVVTSLLVMQTPPRHADMGHALHGAS
jgi:copper transport protein